MVVNRIDMLPFWKLETLHLPWTCLKSCVSNSVVTETHENYTSSWRSRCSYHNNMCSNLWSPLTCIRHIRRLRMFCTCCDVMSVMKRNERCEMFWQINMLHSFVKADNFQEFMLKLSKPRIKTSWSYCLMYLEMVLYI